MLQKRWEAKLVASGALGPLVKREADEVERKRLEEDEGKGKDQWKPPVTEVF